MVTYQECNDSDGYQARPGCDNEEESGHPTRKSLTSCEMFSRKSALLTKCLKYEGKYRKVTRQPRNIIRKEIKQSQFSYLKSNWAIQLSPDVVL